MKKILSKIGLKYIQLEEWIRNVPEYISDIYFDDFIMSVFFVIIGMVIVAGTGIIVVQVLS